MTAQRLTTCSLNLNADEARMLCGAQPLNVESAQFLFAVLNYVATANERRTHEVNFDSHSLLRGGMSHVTTSNPPHPELLPVDPLSTGPMTFTIVAVRPNQLWTGTAVCRHGTLVEYIASNGGQPNSAIVGATTGRNLRNRTGCDCQLP